MYEHKFQNKTYVFNSLKDMEIAIWIYDHLLKGTLNEFEYVLILSDIQFENKE